MRASSVEIFGRYFPPLKTRGFTLIELLIVVAIIAILAAIAVPNFLEAQVRAKVSRVRSDMRTLATALESYFVDNNKYPTDRPTRPQGGNAGTETLANELTTPISYISSLTIANDAFRVGRSDLQATPARQVLNYRNTLELQNVQPNPSAARDTFANHIARREGAWRLISAGPDRYTFNTVLGQTATDYMDFNHTINYDPTNGTVSVGDIFRTAKFADKIAEPGDWLP
jgi:prepilin-type N-terminal cleavage/methylation domain-containing protein